jgi:hypothetical protein
MEEFFGSFYNFNLYTYTSFTMTVLQKLGFEDFSGFPKLRDKEACYWPF